MPAAVISMLVFVLFFNATGSDQKMSALAFSSFALSDVTDSYGGATPDSNGRGAAEDAVADPAVSGQGGVVVPQSEEETSNYPTGWDDALVADMAPLVIDQNQTSRDQIVYYVVEDGDTVSDIATRYGIEQSTLLWANSLSAVDYIRAGQRLEVLPTDGVKYTVQKNDTVGSIAKKFKATESDIIAYNHLPADGALREGDTLILPDGVMPAPPRPKPQPSSIVQAPLVPSAKISLNGFFVAPTSGRRSQALHSYNAIDIANQCGTPIYAAADGVVTSAKVTASRARVGNAVFSGYGNHIKITHPNGVVTLYAHLMEDSIVVAEGATVAQGAPIGRMGGGFEYVNGKLVRMEGAGRSSGCHLHFEVRGAKNPFTGQRAF
ncbi:MAG: M23 family metallopeptidase [Patescibacteria group bacterium]